MSKEKITNGAAWQRNLSKQAKSVYSIIKKEIKKEKNQGLKTSHLTRLMTKSPHFVGVFAENELNGLTINSFPSFLICNIDKSSQPGSHWMAVGIFKKRIEIFDPAGFRIFLWPRIPCHLLTFIHNLSVSRTVHVSKRIQSSKSSLCGYFAMFYILARNTLSFTQIQKLFTSRLARNDLAIKLLFYLN